jgi:hypothetical protein
MFARLFRSRIQQFRIRSAERDERSDQSALALVDTALTHALDKLQAERNGLADRVQAALIRASMTVGTGTDEYLTREPSRTSNLRVFETDLARGTDRIAQIDKRLKDLSFVRAVFCRRFPEFKSTANPQNANLQNSSLRNS